VDRAGARERAHRLGDVEELHDASRRRRVEHDGVVERHTASPAAVLADGAPDALLDLPGQQHVTEARRQRGRELDRAHPPQRPAGEAEVVEHLEVLEQGRLGVHRQPADLAAVGGDGDALLGVRQRRGVEDLGDALPALHLDEQGATPARGEREGQCGGERRLARAALAAHHVEPGLGEGGGPALIGHAVHPRPGPAHSRAVRTGSGSQRCRGPSLPSPT
jgi:hypothetical protein